MTKHEEYYRRMIDENSALFNDFMDLHDKYEKNPQIWQSEFNRKGEKIVGIIRAWERRLCSHSEKGSYGKYSANLADKFWYLVRNDFSKIDFIGVKAISST